ncbi:hypothetical protein RUM44_009946 [Polyplax serrata]|uniref:Uncharacterized protein n=1 Tax=Polyplax serrata TaxID=468196 RepID=A0ABR1AU62_POLSC
MKETSTKKIINQQDFKQSSRLTLKNCVASAKKTQNRENCKRRAVDAFTELPSLQCGSPIQNVLYRREPGPLRLNLRSGNSYWKTKNLCSENKNLGRLSILTDRKESRTGVLASLNRSPSDRRVHFAELPKKNNCFLFEGNDLDEKNLDHREEKRESESFPTNRIRISGTERNAMSNSSNGRDELSTSVSLPSSVKINGLQLCNERVPSIGASQISHQLKTTLKDITSSHETVKYRHGSLSHKPSGSLPAILRAAKDGDDEEVAEVLKKATLFGISPEDLNAVDASGRTALSYIASNGNQKNLKAILKLSKLDVNKGDNEGNTPLHFASQAGQVELINYMLSICPHLEIDARNAVGLTPLMKAALQGRTKCAKLLLFAGASPSLKDWGRGLRAEEWAKYCGRHGCAEAIEKFSKQKNSTFGKWGSEPEFSRMHNPKIKSQIIPSSSGSNIKLKLQKAFGTSSHPGSNSNGMYSVVTQLSTVALCASSPVLQSSTSPSIKSLLRPLSVPKVEVTLASSPNTNCAESLQHSSSAGCIREKPISRTFNAPLKKKK